MRVSDCRKCEFHSERRYSTYYEPRNYHPIGMSHRYAFCELTKRRCSDVKDSECHDAIANNLIRMMEAEDWMGCDEDAVNEEIEHNERVDKR